MQGLGYHWEMWSLAMGGMCPEEVLQAATIDGARIIGIEADLGSIEQGKLADLVVLDANPLDDIRNTGSVWRVMKSGVLYEGASPRCGRGQAAPCRRSGGGARTRGQHPYLLPARELCCD